MEHGIQSFHGTTPWEINFSNSFSKFLESFTEAYTKCSIVNINQHQRRTIFLERRNAQHVYAQYLLTSSKFLHVKVNACCWKNIDFFFPDNQISGPNLFQASSTLGLLLLCFFICLFFACLPLSNVGGTHRPITKYSYASKKILM